MTTQSARPDDRRVLALAREILAGELDKVDEAIAALKGASDVVREELEHSLRHIQIQSDLFEKYPGVYETCREHLAESIVVAEMRLGIDAT